MHDKRRSELTQWVRDKLASPTLELTSLHGDASFRRYFRATLDNKESYIAVDSPPDKEDNNAFVAVQRTFEKNGISVPRIYHTEMEQGFMLLSDLGDTLYLQELTADNCDVLYQDAIDALHSIQACKDFNTWQLPPYDEKLFSYENNLFTEWFLGKNLNVSLSKSHTQLLEDVYTLLIKNAHAQPQLCVHRDYHSRNLMINRANNPAVIDFQGAVLGPITYDLASLFRDCYINWPEDKVAEWLDYYKDGALERALINKEQYDEFNRWFDLMGLQRNVKTIGIFSRLSIRDGKHQYLDDIPRTLNYALHTTTKYPELNDFHEFLQEEVKTQLARDEVL